MIGSRIERVLCGWFLVGAALAVEPELLVTSVDAPGPGLAVKLATQVGRPYDSRAVEQDVRYLWSLRRFDDIRVETAERDSGIAVTFRATPAPHLFLHEVRIEPHTYELALKIPAGTPLTPLRAHEIAMDAQRQLNDDGYPGARVRYEFTPAREGVDLKLHVDRGSLIKVRGVWFEGDTALHNRLQDLKGHRILPGIPHLWGGWKLDAPYSPGAVNRDVAHLRSLYMERGYLDAQVRAANVDIDGKNAWVTIDSHPGSLYPAATGVCSTLFAERREAQRQGVLDFTARLDTVHVEDGPQVELGRPYRVGRIEFQGNRHFRDDTIRRNLLIGESDLLDEYRLRQSIARLNRAMFFEPLDARQVVVEPDEKTGFANITMHLRERKRGSWKFAGPVGTLSVSGPLEAALQTRLPAWGRGLLELSGYTASMGIFVFGKPLLPIVNAPKHFTPVLALERAFTPAAGWQSGFTIVPQLGYRTSLLSYGTTQVQQRLQPVLWGSRGLVRDLDVHVQRASGEAILSCEPPAPRFEPLRVAGGMALHFLGMLPYL